MEQIRYNKTTGLIVLNKRKEFQIGLYDFSTFQLLAYCHIKLNDNAYEIVNLDAKSGFTDFIYDAALMTVYPIGISEPNENINDHQVVNYRKGDNDFLELLKRGTDLLELYETSPDECISRGYNFLLDRLQFNN